MLEGSQAMLEGSTKRARAPAAACCFCCCSCCCCSYAESLHAYPGHEEAPTCFSFVRKRAVNVVDTMHCDRLNSTERSRRADQRVRLFWPGHLYKRQRTLDSRIVVSLLNHRVTSGTSAINPAVSQPGHCALRKFLLARGLRFNDLFLPAGVICRVKRCTGAASSLFCGTSQQSDTSLVA